MFCLFINNLDMPIVCVCVQQWRVKVGVAAPTAIAASSTMLLLWKSLIKRLLMMAMRGMGKWDEGQEIGMQM